jgi:hypothetical protein
VISSFRMLMHSKCSRTCDVHLDIYNPLMFREEEKFKLHDVIRLLQLAHAYNLREYLEIKASRTEPIYMKLNGYLLSQQLEGNDDAQYGTPLDFLLELVDDYDVRASFSDTDVIYRLGRNLTVLEESGDV